MTGIGGLSPMSSVLDVGVKWMFANVWALPAMYVPFAFVHFVWIDRKRHEEQKRLVDRFAEATRKNRKK